jgi:hypothetical protein
VIVIIRTRIYEVIDSEGSIPVGKSQICAVDIEMAVPYQIVSVLTSYIAYFEPVQRTPAGVTGLRLRHLFKCTITV